MIHENTNVCLRQYDILSALDHQNIIKAFEKFKYKENDCLIFQYYQSDLLKLLKKSNEPLEENLIRVIFKEILQGVEYLHSQGIIHRDLKPDNVLVGQEGKIVLADFDLARVLQGLPLSKGVATVYYRPPEIFYGDISYDYSLDMWSLGCILAEMILKEPIFKGRSEFEVMYKVYEVLSFADVEYLLIFRKILGLAVLTCRHFLPLEKINPVDPLEM